MKYSYGIKLTLANIRSKSIRQYLSALIRRINMDLHEKGFAGNAGWKDELMSSVYGFSWYLSSPALRDYVRQQLCILLDANILRQIGIKVLPKVQAKKKVFYQRVAVLH